MSDDKTPRQIPQNDLDFNMRVTDPTWGKKGEVSKETSEFLKKTYYEVDEEGNVKLDAEGNPIIHHEEDFFSSLGILTRDFRLSNLSKADYAKCTWWTDFATATAQLGYKRSTAYCVSQVAPTLELSQSKDGFYRELQNTYIQKSTSTTDEPAKKKLFGGGGK